MIGKKSNVKEMEEVSSLSNNINKGTRVIGEIEATGNLRIDGEVEGHVTCKTKLVLGQTCGIKGNITAQYAEIAGKVEGHIEISEVLVLKSTANVRGDIVAAQLMMETGAIFNGTTKMGVAGKEVKLSGFSKSEEKSA